jgi:hypothetical protein
MPAEPGREPAGFAKSTRASTLTTRWSGPAVDNSTGPAIITADASLTRQGQDSMPRGRRDKKLDNRRESGGIYVCLTWRSTFTPTPCWYGR